MVELEWVGWEVAELEWVGCEDENGKVKIGNGD